jgi:hypothetical protein
MQKTRIAIIGGVVLLVIAIVLAIDICIHDKDVVRYTITKEWMESSHRTFDDATECTNYVCYSRGAIDDDAFATGAAVGIAFGSKSKGVAAGIGSAIGASLACKSTCKDLPLDQCNPTKSCDCTQKCDKFKQKYLAGYTKRELTNVTTGAKVVATADYESKHLYDTAEEVRALKVSPSFLGAEFLTTRTSDYDDATFDDERMKKYSSTDSRHVTYRPVRTAATVLSIAGGSLFLGGSHKADELFHRLLPQRVPVNRNGISMDNTLPVVEG